MADDDDLRKAMRGAVAEGDSLKEALMHLANKLPV
jgi:hypothetical protein